MSHDNDSTFLMFQGRAEEATTFCIALFADGKVTELVRHDPTDASKGAVMKASFQIAGQVMRVDHRNGHFPVMLHCFGFGFGFCNCKQPLRGV